MQKLRVMIALTLFGTLLAACGGGGTNNPTAAPAPAATSAPAATAAPAPTAAPAATAVPTQATSGDTKLVKATFARKLSEQQEAVDPTESFKPGETVNISLTFEGRPKSGVVKATFLFREQEIATAEVDFADVNSGVLFSVGENTFAGFTLTPKNPLPLSPNYRVDAFLDGEKLGSYPFAVVAPDDAIASKLGDVVLAAGADDNYNPVDPTETFAADQKVFLVGSGDFGISTWLQAEWYEDGKVIDAGTRSLTLSENKSDVGFAFSLVPEGGWKEGAHEVVLTMNDDEVGRYQFTISSANASAPQPVDNSNYTVYKYPTGLFEIAVPNGWKEQDNSSSSIALVQWASPQPGAALQVAIAELPVELNQGQLADQLTAFLGSFSKSAFGADAEFTTQDAEPQADGSVLQNWTAKNVSGGTTEISGRTYVQQKGNKLSFLTLLGTSDKFEALLADTLEASVASYTINPDSALK